MMRQENLTIKTGVSRLARLLLELSNQGSPLFIVIAKVGRSSRPEAISPE
jgi:hypothetical protein